MTDDDLHLAAVLKSVVDSPRRDNSVYQKAMAEARRSFEVAEAAFGGPVRVEMKSKMKRNGKYVMKWTFEPAE